MGPGGHKVGRETFMCWADDAIWTCLLEGVWWSQHRLGQTARTPKL